MSNERAPLRDAMLAKVVKERNDALARVEQLEQSLTELIEWIDNRKFEQIHKYCGCTYCRTRETLRRNDGTN